MLTQADKRRILGGRRHKRRQLAGVDGDRRAARGRFVLSTNNVVNVAGKPALLFLYDSNGDLVNDSVNKQKIFVYDSAGNKKETCLV